MTVSCKWFLFACDAPSSFVSLWFLLFCSTSQQVVPIYCVEPVSWYFVSYLVSASPILIDFERRIILSSLSINNLKRISVYFNEIWISCKRSVLFSYLCLLVFVLCGVVLVSWLAIHQLRTWMNIFFVQLYLSMSSFPDLITVKLN